MKKLLPPVSAALAIAAFGPSALASDIGFAPASYDWQGAYFGANIGAGINNSQISSRYSYKGSEAITPEAADLIDSMGQSYDSTDAGFSGGISAGYNWQYDSVVLGLEADINYLDATGSQSRNVSDIVNSIFASDATSAKERLQVESEWFGTIRGRLGYAADNILLYGTGGFAYGNATASSRFDATNGGEYANWNGSDDGWRFGWTLGAGMEYGIDHWTLGVEYLYVDLGTYKWGADADIALADAALEDAWRDVKGRGEMDYAFSVIRGTVKYRF